MGPLPLASSPFPPFSTLIFNGKMCRAGSSSTYVRNLAVKWLKSFYKAPFIVSEEKQVIKKRSCLILDAYFSRKWPIFWKFSLLSIDSKGIRSCPSLI